MRIDLLLLLVVASALAVTAVLLVTHSQVVLGVIVGVLAIPVGQAASLAFDVLSARRRTK